MKTILTVFQFDVNFFEREGFLSLHARVNVPRGLLSQVWAHPFLVQLCQKGSDAFAGRSSVLHGAQDLI
jgi:hypothetical protein